MESDKTKQAQKPPSLPTKPNAKQPAYVRASVQMPPELKRLLAAGGKITAVRDAGE